MTFFERMAQGCEHLQRKEKVEISLIGGVEGDCLAVGDRRVWGPKPWGGGCILKTYQADRAGVISGAFGDSWHSGQYAKDVLSLTPSVWLAMGEMVEGVNALFCSRVGLEHPDYFTEIIGPLKVLAAWNQAKEQKP
jgi:hypothetical protein